jgi:hypothetical protein
MNNYVLNEVLITFQNGMRSIQNENRTIPQIKDFYKLGMRFGYFDGNDFKTSYIANYTITSKFNKNGIQQRKQTSKR